MRYSPDYSESNFVDLVAGRYKLRVKSAKDIPNDPNRGPCINWTFEVFGNLDNPKFNGRLVFHTTPLFGKFSGSLRLLLIALNPDYAGGEFDTDEYIGKDIEADLFFPVFKDGKVSKYISIKKAYPLVSEGSLSSTEFDPSQY